jgi:hypothetical protein
MERNSEQETRRAMELVARLPDVMPDQASERVGRIYGEIQDTLRVPIVNLILRTWERTGDLDRIRAFKDTIHYVLPKLLLTVTLLHEMDFGPSRSGVVAGAPADDGSTIPAGPAEGATKVEMVDPDTAEPRVRTLFQAVRERHGHPLVSSYYRGLGKALVDGPQAARTSRFSATRAESGR